MQECIMGKAYDETMEEYRATRRRLLIAAAAKTLVKGGIRQTTMDDVAATAGVSKVILYRYFGNKEGMVHAILEDVVDKILAVDAIEADWWTERVQRTLGVVRDRFDAFIILVKHSAHDPVYGVHFDRLFDGLVERCQERLGAILGVGRETPVDGLFLAETVTALFIDAYVRWLESGRPENDDAFLDWLTRSVRALSYYWGGEIPPDN